MAVCFSPGFVVGGSDIINQLYKQMQRVAQTDTTVLITGETGSGKEMVARAIYNLSGRSEKNLVCVNCSALSGPLLESELFGHDKGAFTGAEMTRLGYFELADQGTILLDEISELDIRLQAKLLRILENQTFERVGSSFTKKIDVRIIATTNQDLEKRVKDGAFRADLYFRLNVVPIHLPALREHKEDITELVQHFIMERRKSYKLPYKTISVDAVNALSEYNYPGNVRELFSILARLLTSVINETISCDDVMDVFKDMQGNQPAIPLISSGTFDLKRIEREVINASLLHYGGNRLRTAQALGIADRTLRMKIKNYSL